MKSLLPLGIRRPQYFFIRALKKLWIIIIVIIPGCHSNVKQLFLPSNTVLPTDNVNGVTAGTMAGSLNVANDGSATFTLPLWTSPGRANIEPHLSLEYSSRAANGILGVGWRLAGLSTISRSNFFPALDQYAAPINYKIDDGLSLDGDRLILTKGRWGSEGSEYRTEHDRFVKVILHGPDSQGPGWFEAWQKNGEIWKYGASPDSRLETKRITVFATDDISTIPTPPNLVDQSFPIRTSWELSEIEDRNGNSMEIKWLTYQSNSSIPGTSVQILPEEIDYTINNKGNNNLLADRSVKFFYEDRPDRDFQFNSGLKTELIKRLYSIEVWGPDGNKNSLLRSYQFSYVNTSITKRSLLKSVTQSDGFGIKMSPIVFDWENGLAEFEMIDTQIGDLSTDPIDRWFQCLDINGDGYDDLLYIPNADRRDGPPRTYSVRLGNGSGFGMLRNLLVTAPVSGKRPSQVDLNGDSRKDLLLFVDNYSNPTDKDVPLFYESTFLAGDRNRIALTLRKASDKKLALGLDANGDGLTDIVSYNEDDPGSWEYFLNQSGTFPAFGTSFIGPKDVVTTLFQGGRHEINLPDMDGDGAIELVGWANKYDNFRSAYELGRSPRVPPDRVYMSTLPAGVFSPFMDVNGDGLSDQVKTDYQPGILFNVGKWHTNPIMSSAGIVYLPGYMNYDAGIRIFDVNSDGKMDLLVRLMNPVSPNTLDYIPTDRDYVLESTGNDFIGFDPHIGGLPTNSSDIGLVQPLDIDGNGLDDLLIFDGTSLKLYKRKGKMPDLLTSVTDGFGATTEINYKDIADPTVHHRDYNATYPSTNLVSKLWVVSDCQKPDGIGGVRHYRYTYSDSRADKRGRSFLGFTGIEIQDMESGSKQFKSFDLSTNATGSYYPYVDLPVKDSLVIPLANGTVFTKCVNTQYETHENWAAGFYFPYAKTIIETDREGPPALLPVVSSLTANQNVDDYGNITKIIRTTGDGEKYTVTASFENEESDWLIQRLILLTESSIVKPGFGRSRTIGFEYDTKGMLKRKLIEPGARMNGIYKPLIQPQPDGVKTLSINYYYDDQGQVKKIVTGDPDDPVNWRTVNYNYDLTDGVFLSGVQDPMGKWTLTKFHPGFGVLALSQNSNNVQEIRKFDGFGRLRSDIEKGSIGFTENYDFIPGTVTSGGSGLLQVQLKQQDGQEFIVENNVLGNETQRKIYSGLHGQEVIISREYDNLGRVKKVSTPHFNSDPNPGYTQYKYDNLDRIVSMIKPDNTGYQQIFNGRSVILIQGKGQHSQVYLDQSGRIDSMIEFMPLIDKTQTIPVKTYYEYGPFSNLERVRDETGKKAFYVLHDRLGRQIGCEDKDMGRRKFAYSVFGEVEKLLIGKGPGVEISNNFYDKNGRLIMIVNSDGKTRYAWDKSPNGDGMISSTESPDGINTHYDYNLDGKLIGIDWNIQGTSYKINYETDDMGRINTIEYPVLPGQKPLQIHYHYGARGAVIKITDDKNGNTIWTGLGTDENGQPTNPSGEFPQFKLGDEITTRYIEDNSIRGQLHEIQSRKPDGSLLKDLDFKFDHAGNLKEKVDGIEDFNETYLYDSQNRLGKWSVSGAWNHSEEFDYDVLGNLKSRNMISGQGSSITYEYGMGSAGIHAVTKRQSDIYGYDKKGNQISGPGRTLTFTNFDLPKILSSNGQTYNFGYDAFQNRVLTKKNNIITSVTLLGLYETNNEGGQTEHRFNIVKDDQAIAQIVYSENNGAVTAKKIFYMYRDQLGSVDLVTGANGNVIDRVKYDPWGKRMNPDGSTYVSTSGIQTGFTGHTHEDDIGLINMRGRTYDPLTCRFLTPDPITHDFFPLSYNRYQYSYNNPVRWTDPSGFQVDIPESNNRGNSNFFLVEDGIEYDFTHGDLPPSFRPADNVQAESNSVQKVKKPRIDYVFLNGSMGAVNFSLSVDRFLRPYYSIGGAYTGSLRTPGLSVGVGLMTHITTGEVTKTTIPQFITGATFSASYSMIIGAGYAQNFSGSAVEFTLGTPGGSVGLTYGKENHFLDQFPDWIYFNTHNNWRQDSPAEIENQRFYENTMEKLKTWFPNSQSYEPIPIIRNEQ